MRTLFLFSCILFFGLLLSCRKEKPLDPYWACKATKADTSFQIQELVGFWDSTRYFSTDTIFASHNLTYFKATDTTADEYIWQFGTDPRTFSGKTVSLKFTQPYGAVPVTLIQKRIPGNQCYGKLPSEVTYTKNLIVVTKPLILGNFYGYNQSDTTKKFMVSVLNNGVTNIPFPTGHQYNFWNEVEYGSTSFYLAGSGTYDPDFGAYATSGYGYLKNDNQVLYIDYFYSMPTANGRILKKDTYIGVRK